MTVARAALATLSSGLLATALLSAPPAMAAPGAATLPHDLSAWGMFLAADWVVKAVMILLALASVATWTVLVAKSRELTKALKAHQEAYRRIDTATDLMDAGRTVGADAPAAAALLAAAQLEIGQSAGGLADTDGLKERISSRLERIEAGAARRMQRGTGLLATIGSTAPFVGLFGTVWGIMNSFVGIAETQTTNLAVVAPGIAEALLATAIGLVAAIPAVVIYNHFTRRIAGYKAVVADISASVLRLVSREASRGRIAPLPEMAQAAE